MYQVSNMYLKVFLLTVILASASAFAPVSRMSARTTSGASSLEMVNKNTFTSAVNDWAKEYPYAYNVGWGPTTKAERWNGRHAMFGWFALIMTGYAKAHNLIPDGDVALSIKDWGTLAYIYGGSITNERAIIIVGHLHLLLFSVCAAVAPLSFQDKLYLEDGEEHEPAAGLFVKAAPGLTAGAEMWNGRLAMLGLTALTSQAAITQTPILDVINQWLGGQLM